MTQLSLQRYLRTLNQYKWLGLASFAACVGVAGAIAFKPGQPPLYQVHAILELFQQQLPQQIMQARKAAKHLEDYERFADKENSPQRANQRVLLEQELKLRQEQLYKSQLALEDARLASAVQTANLTIQGISFASARTANYLNPLELQV